MNRSPSLLARRVAAFGLHTDGGLIAAAPLPDEQWRQFVQLVQQHRLQGLLATAIAEERFAATDQQAAQTRHHHRRAMSRALELERDLVRLSTRLDSFGYSWRALKGAASAHLDYPDPAMRPFRDVDVLIDADGIENVRDVLIADGAQRRFPEPRPGYDRRFGKGICLVAATGRELDLHRTLSPGPFGLTIVLGDLFDGVTPFVLAGREIPALDRPRRFVHACYHALLGSASPQLMTLRDLVQTAPVDATELRAIATLAHRWRGEAVVAGAVAAASDVLSWTPPPALAAHIAAQHTRRWDAVALAAYHGRRRSSALQAITGLAVVSGVRPRMAYAAAMLAPREHRHPARRRLKRGLDAAKGIMTR